MAMTILIVNCVYGTVSGSAVFPGPQFFPLPITQHLGPSYGVKVKTQHPRLPH